MKQEQLGLYGTKTHRKLNTVKKSTWYLGSQEESEERDFSTHKSLIGGRRATFISKHAHRQTHRRSLWIYVVVRGEVSWSLSGMKWWGEEIARTSEQLCIVKHDRPEGRGLPVPNSLTPLCRLDLMHCLQLNSLFSFVVVLLTLQTPQSPSWGSRMQALVWTLASANRV